MLPDDVHVAGRSAGMQAIGIAGKPIENVQIRAGRCGHGRTLPSEK